MIYFMRRILLIIIPCLFLSACANKQATNDMTKKIRQPAVAGQFYPAEASKLKEQIDNYLNQATSSSDISEIRAMMVPHAGYDYSGPVAAYGYKLLSGRKINTVVLIGNSHQAYFSGVAIDENDSWQTPLGTVAVDKSLAEKLISSDSSIKFSGQPHQSEHSLEVQLPFLQAVLKGDFKILPILFGNEPSEKNWQKLSQALAKDLGNDDIVIASSDMSHYPTDEEAQKIDPETLAKVEVGNVDELEQYIYQVEKENIANEQTLLCGVEAVKTVMALAQTENWKASVLKYANSWQTSGLDKTRVVGYGVVTFATKKSELRSKNENESIKATSTISSVVSQTLDMGELNDEEKNELLKIANETVRSFVVNGTVPQFNITDERLKRKQGAFVTLYKNGNLRGCIGLIEPSDKPLWQVVRDMAVAACSQDPRFNPVTKDELSNLHYEVSVLSVPQVIDDWHKIVLGRDGVIIQKDFHSGVFLPQVATETGWSLEEFLAQLCWQKAELAPDEYKSKDVILKVFTAQVFSPE